MPRHLSYVFGPVASGRLGRSLGLDLLGGRVCTFDCLYCEVGETQELTLTRKPYVPAKAILDELAFWKERHPNTELDHVTLGGLGEPTLNSEMVAVMEGVRATLPGVPVAVLTNASLMPMAEVRAELLGADVVLPSLDSLVRDEFLSINRPHGGLDPETIAEALLTFRKEYNGRICLEVLLAEAFNDSRENRSRLAAYVKELAPDRVDVVTMTRPGATQAARPVSPVTLAVWRSALSHAPASGIENLPRQEHRPPHSAQEETGEKVKSEEKNPREAISHSLAHRPQSIPQLAEALNIEEDVVMAIVGELHAAGEAQKLPERDQIGAHFYFIP